MISILLPIRIDHFDRLRNLELFLEFYSRQEWEIIIYEDGPTPNQYVQQICERHINKNVLVNFHKNSSFFCKGLLYNSAAKISNGNYLVAMDVDAIIHPDFIMNGISLIDEAESKSIAVPYNGSALYMTPLLKSIFQENLVYNTLSGYLPEDWSYRYRDKYIYVANIHSVGGCVVFKRSDYFDAGGFNPHFKGWGYEDNEILYRYGKLGYDVKRVKNKDAVLWHMHHDGAIRDDNPHLCGNVKIMRDIKLMNIEQLKDYVAGWNNG